jgi:clan AA aspartic protease
LTGNTLKYDRHVGSIARMGHVYVDAVLSAERSEVVRMLVDTGATYSLVSNELATRLGMPRLPKRTRVRLADGSVRRVEIGIARLRLEGREAAPTFIIGRVAEPLLGVEALEALGLAADPSTGKLVPTRSAALLLATLAS